MVLQSKEEFLQSLVGDVIYSDFKEIKIIEGLIGGERLGRMSIIITGFDSNSLYVVIDKLGYKGKILISKVIRYGLVPGSPDSDPKWLLKKKYRSN